MVGKMKLLILKAEINTIILKAFIKIFTKRNEKERGKFNIIETSSLDNRELWLHLETTTLKPFIVILESWFDM